LYNNQTEPVPLLIDVVDIALNDPREYPSKDSSAYLAIKRLHDRLKEEYRRAFD
jgi:hypothetical protein